MSVDDISRDLDASGEPESYRSILKDVFVAYKTPISLFLILGGAWFALKFWNELQAPDFVTVALHWMAIGVPVGAILGKRILKSLISEDTNPLLTINYEQQDVRPSLWNFGDAAWSELEVSKGQLVGDGILKVAISYDPDSHSAVGVPIESLSEMEILRFKSSLKEARGMLWEQAAAGTAAQESVRMATFRVNKMSLRSALSKLVGKGSFSGSEVNDIVDEVVEEAKVSSIADELADSSVGDSVAPSDSGDESSESVLERARRVEAQADDNEGDSDE